MKEVVVWLTISWVSSMLLLALAALNRNTPVPAPYFYFTATVLVVSMGYGAFYRGVKKALDAETPLDPDNKGQEDD